MRRRRQNSQPDAALARRIASRAWRPARRGLARRAPCSSRRWGWMAACALGAFPRAEPPSGAAPQLRRRARFRQGRAPRLASRRAPRTGALAPACGRTAAASLTRFALVPLPASTRRSPRCWFRRNSRLYSLVPRLALPAWPPLASLERSTPCPVPPPPDLESQILPPSDLEQRLRAAEGGRNEARGVARARALGDGQRSLAVGVCEEAAGRRPGSR